MSWPWKKTKTISSQDINMHQTWTSDSFHPHLFMLGANEEVGGAVLRGVDHQRVVGGQQLPGSSSLIVLV